MRHNICLRAVLASSLLLLLASGALAAHSRAYASASASASGMGRNMRRRLLQGESVTASASATGTPGSPSSAISQATGVPGAVVNCDVVAGPGQANSAICPPSTPSFGGSAPSGRASPAWRDAPACSKAKVTAKDSQGNPWGFENGRSCAVRTAGK